MEQPQKNKSRKPLIILAIVFALMAGSGIYYWLRSAAFETTDDAQLDGNIYAVRSGVTAYLQQIRFTDNHYVTKGDTLFIFDTTALKAQVAQAKAALENARTKLSVTDIQALASQQNAHASQQNALSNLATIEAAKAKMVNTQSIFNRDKELLKIDAVTQSQYDADKVALSQAEAAYQQATHLHQSASINAKGLSTMAQADKHQISAAAATIEQRTAELKLAEDQLSHAFVIAPCNGIVTKRAVNTGQYVLAGQSLCAVVDNRHLWVTANFKETQLQRIKVGQKVSISVDAFPDLDLNGVVQSFSGATGAEFALIPADNATGNFIKVTQRFPLRIQIDLHERTSTSALFPGLSVFVKVKTN